MFKLTIEIPESVITNQLKNKKEEVKEEYTLNARNEFDINYRNVQYYELKYNDMTKKYFRLKDIFYEAYLLGLHLGFGGEDIIDYDKYEHKTPKCKYTFSFYNTTYDCKQSLNDVIYHCRSALDGYYKALICLENDIEQNTHLLLSKLVNDFYNHYNYIKHFLEVFIKEKKVIEDEKN